MRLSTSTTPTAMRLAATLLWAACCSMVACGSPLDDGPGSPPDGPGDPDDYPGCHWDCFGGRSCEDGVVNTYARRVVPCSEWEGDCPIEDSYTCEQGCRTDIDEIPDEQDTSLLCEEHRPRAAGEPCDDELDCRPFTIITEPDGSLRPIHLACDVQQGTCVEVEPPVIDGYMASCDVTPSDIANRPPTPLHLLDDTSCVTGLCLAHSDVSQGCVPQGCTIACTEHADCPAGALCETMYPGETGPDAPRVCMPMTTRPPGYDLACPGETPEPGIAVESFSRSAVIW